MTTEAKKTAVKKTTRARKPAVKAVAAKPLSPLQKALLSGVSSRAMVR